MLDDNAVLIYPNTPAKAANNQTVVVRSFFLGDIDPKQVLPMLKARIGARDVYVDEKLNLLVIRDTLQAVELAEKLLLSADRAEPAIILQLELIEVAQSKLQELGVRYSPSIPSGTPSAGGISTAKVNQTNFGFKAWVANPTLLAKLHKLSTTTLADSSTRVTNRERARVQVGETLPAITGAAGAESSSRVNYVDAGLKVDAEANVYLENEIAVKLTVVVSTVVEQRSVQGIAAYRVDTRTAATALRLRDGEAQLVAGLINDEDRRSAAKVAGVDKLPVVGRLFSNDAHNRREVLLLITPRLVRGPGLDPHEVNSRTAPAGGESVAPASPASIARPPSASRAIALTAPANVKPGEVFSVQVKVPMAVFRGRLQLSFDDRAFVFVGASVPVQAMPGAVTVLIDRKVAAPVVAEIKFKSLGKPLTAPSRFALDSAQFLDAGGSQIQGQAPPPALVMIGD